MALACCSGRCWPFSSAELLQTLLFDVRPSDPIALAIAAIAFGVVAVTACFLPAFRASRVDLMQVPASGLTANSRPAPTLCLSKAAPLFCALRGTELDEPRGLQFAESPRPSHIEILNYRQVGHGPLCAPAGFDPVCDDGPQQESHIPEKLKRSFDAHNQGRPCGLRLSFG